MADLKKNNNILLGILIITSSVILFGCGKDMGEDASKDMRIIAKINNYVVGVILIGLGVGIIVFLSIGLLFSNQIIK